MKKILPILITILFFFVLGCTDESPIAPESDLIVIRGYIYAGEPVSDIQLTHTLALGSEETTAPPVNDAVVYLLKEGQRYDLVLSPGDSGYYFYPGNDLIIAENDEIEIRVEYGGNLVTGNTIVPAPPKDVEISENTLYVPEEIMGFGGGQDSTRSLTVTWQQEESALFYVTVENVETNPDTIEIAGFFNARNGMRFISIPRNVNEYRINLMTLNFYGKHLLKVYRVNQEYADLYQSRMQDTRDLNEPLTNIENGLGVFSAFNSDSLYFYVVPE